MTSSAVSPNREGKRVIPLSRKLLYMTLVMVLFFGGIELLARAFWQPEISEDVVGTRKFVTWLSSLALGARAPLDLYQSDPQRLWRLVPDRHYRSANDHHAEDGEVQPIEITINQRGYRGELVSADRAAQAALSILCLGDSQFFGYPLDDRDAFPCVLGETLAAQNSQRDVCVVNAGIPGYTSLQGRAWYDEEFSQLPYNWLLLSFICNDGWAQPQTDRELISRGPPSAAARCAQTVVDSSRALQAAQSLVGKLKPVDRHVPRVERPDFIAHYEYFIAQAARRNARVLILDYSVYPEYDGYSQDLIRLAERNAHVKYLRVPQLATAALNAGEIPITYADRLDKVRHRWGYKTLAEKPHLWLYAEFYPEHLNELGTRWLAAKVAEVITAAHQQAVETGRDGTSATVPANK